MDDGSPVQRASTRFGSAGDDELYGGNDKDRLDGGAGVHGLFGDSRNDTLIRRPLAGPQRELRSRDSARRPSAVSASPFGCSSTSAVAFRR
jgi:Ca2+-binding RTX toxin-like protein